MNIISIVLFLLTITVIFILIKLYSTKSDNCPEQCVTILKNSIPDLSPYAKTEEVSALRNSIPSMPDLKLYAKTEDVTALRESIPSMPDLSPYAKMSDLTRYATTSDVSRDYALKDSMPDLSPYATTEDVSALRNSIPSMPDLSPYAKTEDVTALRNSIPSMPDLSPYAKTEDVTALRNSIPSMPDLSPYATTEEVTALRNSIPSMPDLSPYAKTEDVTALRNSIPSMPDLSPYAKTEDVTALRDSIPSMPHLSQYAKTSEVSRDYALKDPSNPDLSLSSLNEMFIRFDDKYSKDYNEFWQGIGASRLPIGTIIPYSGSTAPAGFLLCNGATYSGYSDVYSKLFDVIRYTYGGNNGNFKVPNINGRTIIGVGDNNTLASTGGSQKFTFTKYLAADGGYLGYTGSPTQVISVINEDNMQPYITLNYIIKYEHPTNIVTENYTMSPYFGVM